jgi:hypothetical protein
VEPDSHRPLEMHGRWQGHDWQLQTSLA